MTAIDRPPTEIIDRTVACLGSDRRPAFLAELAYEFSLRARGLYPPPDTESYRLDAPFICHNELQQVVASQLRADLGDGTDGYPDPALMRVLVDKARIWGCEDHLRDALANALARVPPSPRHVPPAASNAFDRAVWCLGSEHRRAFLAELLSELSLATPATDPSPGTEADLRAAGYRCHNDLLRVLAFQLRADLGGQDHGAADDFAFLQALTGEARSRGCRASLSYSLERALAAVASPTPPRRG